MITALLCLTLACTSLPIRVVTVYHATEAQTDSTPFTTADGTTWDADRIATRRIAAVSQELLWWNGGPVRYGDWLWVDIPDKRLAGLWRVYDTMWAGVKGYVDLLGPEGTQGCWRSEGAVVRHPEGCPVGAKVYHVPREQGERYDQRRRTCRPGLVCTGTHRRSAPRPY